ncbi:hypothetical protein R6Z07F_010159 [Ovis aries]
MASRADGVLDSEPRRSGSDDRILGRQHTPGKAASSRPAGSSSSEAGALLNQQALLRFFHPKSSFKCDGFPEQLTGRFQPSLPGPPGHAELAGSVGRTHAWMAHSCALVTLTHQPASTIPRGDPCLHVNPEGPELCPPKAAVHGAIADTWINALSWDVSLISHCSPGHGGDSSPGQGRPRASRERPNVPISQKQVSKPEVLTRALRACSAGNRKREHGSHAEGQVTAPATGPTAPTPQAHPEAQHV